MTAIPTQRQTDQIKTAATAAEQPDDYTTTDRKRAYEFAIRVVDYQTGRAQPPLVPETTITQMLCRGYAGPTLAGNVLAKARADGHLFRWRHPDTDRAYLGVDDADALREKVTSYAEYARTGSGPTSWYIGVANQRIKYLELRAAVAVGRGGD